MGAQTNIFPLTRRPFAALRRLADGIEAASSLAQQAEREGRIADAALYRSTATFLAEFAALKVEHYNARLEEAYWGVGRSPAENQHPEGEQSTSLSITDKALQQITVSSENAVSGLAS